jgi:hypothetical protein
MSKLKLSIESIEALSDAQRSVLVRTGIITIESTPAEDALWSVALGLMDRSVVASIIGLQLSTFNTYVTDHYRLCKMKEKLMTIMGADVHQRDIAIINRVTRQFLKRAEQEQTNAV